MRFYVSTTFLKVFLSIAQNAQSPNALTDAERGALYNSASSPNASPLLSVFFKSPFIII